MGLELGAPLGAGDGWYLAEVLVLARSSHPAKDTVCEVDFPQLGPTEMWFIDHATVSNTMPATEARFYENSIDRTTFRTGSRMGTFDEGDWPQGLMIAPGTTLIVQWTNVADGGVGMCKMQVRRYLRRVK